MNNFPIMSGNSIFIEEQHVARIFWQLVNLLRFALVQYLSELIAANF
jgi:hypothetical protein